MTDPTMDVIHCPGCGTGLRVPRVEARIRITCPSCTGQFEWARPAAGRPASDAATAAPASGGADPFSDIFGPIAGMPRPPGARHAAGAAPESPAPPTRSAPIASTEPAPAPASAAPAAGGGFAAPSRRPRIWTGILIVAAAGAAVPYIGSGDAPPIVSLAVIAVALWGTARVYRGLRPRSGAGRAPGGAGGPGGLGGAGAAGGTGRRMGRWPAVAATLAIVWGASTTAGLVGTAAIPRFGGVGGLSLGGGTGSGPAGPTRADQRLDRRLAGEAESQLEAARAAAARATTPAARAAAVDAYSEAAASAAFADDLDALEQILEEQLAARGGR